MMWLAIHKKSWHYKYYEKLHRLWAWPLKNNLSLCTYSWMFFILSIMSFATLPVYALGWIFLKFLRISYQIMEKFPIGEKIIDFLDKNLNFGYNIQSITDDMNEAPIPVCLTVGILGSLLIFCFYGMSFMLLEGISACISNIASIPFLIWTAILYIGWLFMWIFFVIGCIINFVITVVSLLCIFIYPHMTTFLMFILRWTPIFIGFSICVLLLVYGIIKFFDTKRGKKIVDYLSLKFNGFQKARAETIERREKIEKNKQEAISKKKIINRVTNKKENKPIFFERWYENIKEYLFTGKNKKHGNRDFRVLGFFPMVWKTVISLKNGVCPFIEFIDDEENLEKE